MKLTRVYLTLAAVAAAAVLAGPAIAASVENGKTAFVKNGCWQCHGYEGQGSITTSGGRVIADTQLPADAFAAYVRSPTGAMPPFRAEILSDSDLADIYAYLAARPKPQAAKDIPLLNNP
jgi:ubiquinol-cytochrome c reductase cytochrome c subunit